ncbi:MAG: glycosyltransferase [Lachnospiraceae bacterium]|nr:glycosyltransferase [Lachnospiraceae bacterium]
MNSNIVKTLNYLKKNGPVKTFYAVKERMSENRQTEYIYTPITEEIKKKQTDISKEYTTKVSILVPTYETKPQFMEALIDSAISQTYANWELVLADASKSDIVKATVDKYTDDRIKYVRLEANLGISGNSNAAIAHCTGEYTGLLDHDDVLTEDALFEMVSCIENSKKSDCLLKMIYSDEDKMNADGNEFFDPNIKPDFNLQLLLSNNYICHFLVLETGLLKLLGFRKEYDGAQDHDLILRSVSKLMEEYEESYQNRIGHVDKVLYHWRSHENSTAGNPKSKQYAYESGKRAVQDFVDRQNWNGKVTDIEHMGFFRVEYAPDIFANRKDVAAVGRRIIGKGGLVTDGIYDEHHSVMFEGLNRHHSGGILHRAACQMEVPYVSIRSMIVSETAKPVLEDIINKHSADENPDYKAISIEFCDVMRQKGYIFVYDPKMTVKKKNVQNYFGNTKH